VTYRTAILLLAPATVGILAGYLLGGRLVGLTTVRLRFLWLLWAATGVQIAQYHAIPVGHFLQDRVGLPMFTIVLGLVVLWLGLNVRQPHPLLQAAGGTVLLGAMLNGAALLANGHMPYSTWAARVAGLPATVVTPKNGPADIHTRLLVIGDIVPLPLLGKVLSPGDLLISLGAATAIAVAMRRYPRVSDPVAAGEVNDDHCDHAATRAVRDLPHRVHSHAAVHDRSPGPNRPVSSGEDTVVTLLG
jgi:hypothetical protein